MKKILLIFSAILLATACSKNGVEDLDGISSTEQMQQSQEALIKELTTPENGWRFAYQPKEDKVGGFTILMKFSDDGEVVMTSDIDSDTATATSEYQVKMGQTTMLSFVTKNHIHKLADSSLGKQGNGYYGEFEFLYYGKEGDKLKFKTQRTNKFVYFEKATVADWNNISTIINKEINLGLFAYRPHTLKITTAKGTEEYRATSYESRLLKLSNGDKTISFGTLPTADGMQIMPPLDVEGKKISELKLDNTTQSYKTTVDGVTVELILKTYPEVITDDYKEIDNLAGFANIIQNFLNSLSSVEMRRQYFSSKGKLLYAYRILFRENNVCLIEIWHKFTNNPNILTFRCGYEVKNKKLYINEGEGKLIADDLKVWQGDKDVANAAINLINFFLNDGKEGFYIEKRTEKYGLPNDVYTLQSSKRPQYYFPVYGVPKK